LCSGCGLSGCPDGEEKEDRAKPQSAAEDCAEGHFVGSWIEAVEIIGRLRNARRSGVLSALQHYECKRGMKRGDALPVCGTRDCETTGLRD
jgi:hypothetical protein